MPPYPKPSNHKTANAQDRCAKYPQAVVSDLCSNNEHVEFLSESNHLQHPLPFLELCGVVPVCHTTVDAPSTSEC
jgi:hypothetical protein